MLRSIPAKLFEEWRVYNDVEPFTPQRADYRAASIVQALWNIARDTKRHPDGWPIADFLVQFGDYKREVIKQTLETQEMLIDMWIEGHNLVQALKDKNK